MSSTQRTRILERHQQSYGTEAEYLWARYPDYAVFRHPLSAKWYALFANVPREKLGLDGEGIADLLVVRCGLAMQGSLLCEKGFLPAYHMGKNSWISILLDDSVPDERVELLLEMSYDSVEPKRRK